MFKTREPQKSKKHEPFLNGDFMGGLDIGDVVVELYQLHEFQPLTDSHYTVGYRLWDVRCCDSDDPDYDDSPELIFEGRDYGVPSGKAIDSPVAFIEILGWLLLKPGDTDQTFFNNFTSEQLVWIHQNAENLQSYQISLQDQLASIRNKEVPSWACFDWMAPEHEWLVCSDCQSNWQEQEEWQEHVGHKLYLGDDNEFGIVRVPMTVELSVRCGKHLKQLPDARRMILRTLAAQLADACDNDDADKLKIVDCHYHPPTGEPGKVPVFLINLLEAEVQQIVDAEGLRAWEEPNVESVS